MNLQHFRQNDDRQNCFSTVNYMNNTYLQNCNKFIKVIKSVNHFCLRRDPPQSQNLIASGNSDVRQTPISADTSA